VAEKLMLGSTGSGVGGGPGSDFYRAMSIASRMVRNLGMGKSGIVGDFSAVDNNQISEKTREALDADTQEILQTCLAKTTELLTRHKDLLGYFAEELIKKGDLEHDEIVEIFNKFEIKPAAQLGDKKTVRREEHPLGQ
jgi:ATP-dependent Zn protease